MPSTVLSRSLFGLQLPWCTRSLPSLATLAVTLWHRVAHATAILSGIIFLLYRNVGINTEFNFCPSKICFGAKTVHRLPCRDYS